MKRRATWRIVFGATKDVRRVLRHRAPWLAMAGTAAAVIGKTDQPCAKQGECYAKNPATASKSLSRLEFSPGTATGSAGFDAPTSHPTSRHGGVGRQTSSTSPGRASVALIP
jgi:hypothetical protein